MPNSNLIAGITLHKDTDNDVYICYVENLSDELKEEIRNMFSSIRHGAVEAERSHIYSYDNTVKSFMQMYRYNRDGTEKSSNIKKGIIGEMIAHLLIPKYLPELGAISIMKNKEENSIRKGFDIVYCDNENFLWYCEVKSGGDTNNTEDVNQKNKQLLNKAKTDIQNLFQENRTILWESVLIDVDATVFNSERKIDIKKLLDEHHPYAENRNMERNVILSSVLYKSMAKKICPTRLGNHKNDINNENIFVGLIVFSIQKPTYTKIEEFLIEESNG